MSGVSRKKRSTRNKSAAIEAGLPRGRMWMVQGGLVLLLAAGVVRLYGIQVVHHAFLEAKQKKIAEVQRGLIVDTEHRILAGNEPSWDLYVNLPQERAERAEMLQKLQEAFPAWSEKLAQRARSARKFMYVARKADKDALERFRDLGFGSLEAGVHKNWSRVYPYKDFASQLLGFVGVDGHGLEGLEFSYDKLLLGAGAWQQDTGEPASIRLTLDFEIQRRLQHLLREKLIETESDAAMAVVLEAGTGAVRAAAHVPGYDPNRFGDFSAASRRNRLVTDAFEPGSTVKPFVVAEAFARGLIDPEELIWCENGRWPIYDHVINDVEPNGWLSPRQVLEKSSNICTAKIAQRLEKQGVYDVFSAAGFGNPVQHDFKGEARGILRTTSHFSMVDLATMSFGQGLSVTPLQLAAAWNVFASGGEYYEPYFVEAFLDPDLDLLSAKASQPVRRVFEPATNARMVKILQGVVDRGTGRKARLDGVAIAGKTGTAQVPDLKNGGYKDNEYTALFSGFFPADNPMYTVVVVLEKPKKVSIYGGQVAAPVFREIAHFLMMYKGTMPTMASRMPVAPRQMRAQQRMRGDNAYPDFHGLTMREALRLGSQMDVNLQLQGQGYVVAQDPAPGESLGGMRTLQLQFGKEGGRAL